MNVVHVAVRGRGRGPYGLVDGFFSGAVGGTVIRVVRKALGHLLLTGRGAAGHTQEDRGVELEGKTKTFSLLKMSDFLQLLLD